MQNYVEWCLLRHNNLPSQIYQICWQNQHDCVCHPLRHQSPSLQLNYYCILLIQDVISSSVWLGFLGMQFSWGIKELRYFQTQRYVWLGKVFRPASPREAHDKRWQQTSAWTGSEAVWGTVNIVQYTGLRNLQKRVPTWLWFNSVAV